MRRSTILLIAALIGACEATPAPSGSTAPTLAVGPASTQQTAPTFEAAPCPQDVKDATVAPIECGYLSVLEDRAAPTSRVLRLLVSKIEPRDGAAAPDPMVVLADIRTGSYPDYGGLVEIADRVARTEYILDPRGRAHSDPLLDCPEVAQISPTLVGLRLSDPAHADALRGAVTACADRLAAAGIDPANYGLDDIAADIHDLRTALHIGAWNAIAYGPESALAFALAGPDVADLRSLTLDSPTLGPSSWRTLGPAALDRAIARLSEACGADSACHAAAPDVEDLVQDAVAALNAKPVMLDVDGTPEAILAGHPIRVVIDGTALLRWIRGSISRQRPDGVVILRTVASALAGTLAATDLIAIQLSSDVGDCFGTLPRCDTNPAWGSVFSLVCSGPIGTADASRLIADIGARPAYETLFAHGPLEIACDAWPASGGSIDAAAVAASGIPIVIVRGRFDGFAATPGQLVEAFGSRPNLHLIEIPNGGSNVLGGFECVRSIRNAWVANPDKPPGDVSCIDSIPVIPLPR